MRIRRQPNFADTAFSVFQNWKEMTMRIFAASEAACALGVEGLNSSQVVAINNAGGVLTMFAKAA
jgi:hypothetical protein